MLKKLLGRHRAMQIGVTLLGASALAVGFASPAFAAQSVNNGNGKTMQPHSVSSSCTVREVMLSTAAFGSRLREIPGRCVALRSLVVGLTESFRAVEVDSVEGGGHSDGFTGVP